MHIVYTTALVALSAVAGATPLDVKRRDDPSSCVTALASPTPSSFICGLQGKLTTPTRIARFPAKGSLDTCRSACLGNTKCVSFSYNSQTDFCQTFSKALIRMGWSVDRKSPKAFYNRNCYSYSPVGCNTPTPTSTPTPTPTPTPLSVTPVQPHGYWLQAKVPGQYIDGYYLSGAWIDQNYNAITLGPNADTAANGDLFDLTNGLLSYDTFPFESIVYPFWQQASDCGTPSQAYFYTTPRSSNDVVPSCSTTLSATDERADLICSTASCGAETWSYSGNRLTLGPANSPGSWAGITIAYAYPQITRQSEMFLIQVASTDSSIDGLFVGPAATGASVTLVGDYANAFNFYLYYGIPQSQNQDTFFTGTFTDDAGLVTWGTTTSTPSDNGVPLVICNPVGSLARMSCGAASSSALNPYFITKRSQFSYCVNDATYGTGLALALVPGCSIVTLQIVQPPASATA